VVAPRPEHNSVPSASLSLSLSLCGRSSRVRTRRIGLGDSWDHARTAARMGEQCAGSPVPWLPPHVLYTTTGLAVSAESPAAPVRWHDSSASSDVASVHRSPAGVVVSAVCTVSSV
jgi:hypothetical protein